MWRVASTRRMCSEMTSQSAKKASLLAAVVQPSARAVASVAGAPRPARFIPNARPYPAMTFADPAIAINAERLAVQRTADAALPLPALRDAICWGIWRIAASTKPQVNSAAP